MRSSIRLRLLVSFLAVALLAAGGLSLYFLKELEAFGLRKLEERLDGEARIAASVMAATGPRDLTGTPMSKNARDRLTADYRDTMPRPTSRLRVLNASGMAVFDTGLAPRGQGEGEQYGDLPEVRKALQGTRGVAYRLNTAGRPTLYVAYPVRHGARVVGVSYASASTFSILTLLHSYRSRLIVVVLAFLVGTLVMTELLSRWLSRPLSDLAAGAVALASGDHAARVRPSGARETREVAEAFNAMATDVGRHVAELQEEERRQSRFVSDVSHELRTPLTAIRGAAETLLDGDVPREDQERFLGTIVRESDRLARLANDLIVLQRIEGATGELPLRRLDLRDVADRAVEALSPLLEERGVTASVTGHAPLVLGDRDRLQQVVQNLIDNASRYTPAGGGVRIVLASEAGRSALSVTDEGPGVPEDQLERLFDRFYRTQPSRDRGSGGFGLGLAIVNAIVLAHAGTITAENAEDGGARFTVRLPSLEG